MPTYTEWLTGRGLADTTIRARTKFYRSRLRDWGTFLVPPATITAWLNAYEGWSRHTYFSHFVSVYDWLCEVGQVAENPMRAMKPPPSPRPRPRPLTEAELTEALARGDRNTRAFLMLGFLAGLRAHEIAKIHGRDVTADGLYVFGKGGRGQMLPTHPLLWDLAQTYPRDDFWFPSPVDGHDHLTPGAVTGAVTKLFRSLGIHGSCHRARHSFGASLLRGGANLRVVQELMRHSSLATTAAYLGVDHDEKVLAVGGLNVLAFAA